MTSLTRYYCIVADLNNYSSAFSSLTFPFLLTFCSSCSFWCALFAVHLRHVHGVCEPSTCFPDEMYMVQCALCTLCICTMCMVLMHMVPVHHAHGAYAPWMWCTGDILKWEQKGYMESAMVGRVNLCLIHICRYRPPYSSVVQ